MAVGDMAHVQGETRRREVAAVHVHSHLRLRMRHRRASGGGHEVVALPGVSRRHGACFDRPFAVFPLFQVRECEWPPAQLNVAWSFPNFSVMKMVLRGGWGGAPVPLTRLAASARKRPTATIRPPHPPSRQREKARANDCSAQYSHGKAVFRHRSARRFHLSCHNENTVRNKSQTLVLAGYFCRNAGGFSFEKLVKSISPHHNCTNILRLNMCLSVTNQVKVRPASGRQGSDRSEDAWTPKRQRVKVISRLPNPRGARRNAYPRQGRDRQKPDAPLHNTPPPPTPTPTLQLQLPNPNSPTPTPTPQLQLPLPRVRPEKIFGNAQNT